MVGGIRVQPVGVDARVWVALDEPAAVRVEHPVAVLDQPALQVVLQPLEAHLYLVRAPEHRGLVGVVDRPSAVERVLVPLDDGPRAVGDRHHVELLVLQRVVVVIDIVLHPGRHTIVVHAGVRVVADLREAVDVVAC